MNVIIGVSDCHVSDQAEDVLITYALGSCIAIAIHDPLTHVGGLLHFMLPSAPADALPGNGADKGHACTPGQCSPGALAGAIKGARSPYMFADSGIPLLFREAYRKGAEKRRLRVHVAGGAQVIDTGGVFNIGQKNRVAAQKILWRAGVLVHGEETGGNAARTIRLDLASGRCSVRSPDGSIEREI
jgi:chemotaxis protein CheD